MKIKRFAGTPIKIAATIMVGALILSGCSGISFDSVINVGKDAKKSELDVKATATVLAKERDKWVAVELDMLENRNNVTAVIGFGKPYPAEDLEKMNEDIAALETGLDEWNLKLKVMKDGLGSVEVDLNKVIKALDKLDIKGAPGWVNDFLDTAKELGKKKISYYNSVLDLYAAQANQAGIMLDFGKAQAKALADMNTDDQAAFEAAKQRFNASHAEMVKSGDDFDKKEAKLLKKTSDLKAECAKLEARLDEIAEDNGLKDLFTKTG
jgi:hypothetical protein